MTELQAVTKPMLDAWVAWEPGYDPEPPLTPKQSAFVRHAFYAGWFASQASPPPEDWLVRQLEAWPTRIDPEKTINVEYLMKAAAKQIAALTAMKGTGDE